MIDYTKVLKKIVPTKDGPGEIFRRSMVVAVVNGDNTVDLTSSGATIPSVPVLAGAQLTVGSKVQVLSERGALLVLGKVGAPIPPAVIFPYARVLFGTPSISNSTVTTLTITSAPANIGGMWVSGSTLTVPAGQGGEYEIGTAIQFSSQASGAGQRQARINVNGSTWTYNASTAVGINGTLTGGFVSARRSLNAGDTVAFEAFHQAGVTLTLDAGSHAWVERKR